MSLDALAVSLCLVLGVAVGSFLNVVVHRVPRGESIVRPRSHCPSCRAPIGAAENVPVLSWLVLRGRCRHCRAPIGARYPAVELLTGVLFAATAARFGATAQLPAFLYLAAVGVALAFIDVDVKRLPNVLTLPSYPVSLALLGAAAAATRQPATFERALVGMAALFSFYLLLVTVYPAGMGLGDLKLSGVVGLYLGWVGYGALAVGAFSAFLVGGVAGMAAMFVGTAGRRTRIPFGPFILTGALVGIFAGPAIAAGYGHLVTG